MQPGQSSEIIGGSLSGEISLPRQSECVFSESITALMLDNYVAQPILSTSWLLREMLQ